MDGTWDEILAELRRGSDVEDGLEWTVSVDSSVVRAHQRAAGARRSMAVDGPTGGSVELQES